MRIVKNKGLSFDDVLLIPQHSNITSREDVDLSTSIGNIKLTLPIISANMDTVTESAMAIEMGFYGGAGVLHRFADSRTQQKWLDDCREANVPRILAKGLEEAEFSTCVYGGKNAAFDAICIDVAHGDHSRVVEFITRVRRECPKLNIIAGNVATYHGAKRLVEAGANAVKVGIGPGSVCSTRIVSGHGYPQLSAIDEIHQGLTIGGHREDDENRVSIIADGGIRQPGDIVKALAAGADAVMLGSLLAGTDESAGVLIVENGIAYKTYRGMASREAQVEKRPNRTPRVEGVSAKIPYKGPLANVLQNLEAGIKSGLSYSGSSNLAELRQNAEFIVVTNNTLKESHPHHPYIL